MNVENPFHPSMYSAFIARSSRNGDYSEIPAIPNERDIPHPHFWEKVYTRLYTIRNELNDREVDRQFRLLRFMGDVKKRTQKKNKK